MFKNIFIYLFVLLNFCSCSEKSSKIEQPIFVIHAEPKKNEIQKLPDLISDLTFIKLETNDSNYIKYIYRFEFSENKIFINSEPNKPLYVFNIDGSFDNSIGINGNGPTEFISIQDFIISDKISLFTYPDKVIEYSIEGALLSSYNCGVEINRIVALSDKSFLNYMYRGSTLNRSNNTLSLIDSNFNIVKSYFPIKDFENKYGMETSIFSQGDGYINFLAEYSDNVYKVFDKNITPYVKLDFGEFSITSKTLEKIKTLTPNDYFDYLKKKHVNYIKFYETQNYFWLSYYVQQNTFDCHFTLKEKHSGQEYHFMCNEMEPFSKLFSNIAGSFGDQLVFYINAYDLKSIAEQIRDYSEELDYLNSEMVKKILEVADKTSDLDNPILLFLSLK